MDLARYNYHIFFALPEIIIAIFVKDIHELYENANSWFMLTFQAAINISLWKSCFSVFARLDPIEFLSSNKQKKL